MQRRTKIVATLGPSTDDPKVLDGMIQAGVDVVRVNFSHGTPEEHLRRAENVRNRARAHGRQVGVLADLQGPKIRIARFTDDKVVLQEGARFILDAALDVEAGNQERVGLTYKALTDDVKRGDTLLLDDGAVVLWVEEVTGAEIETRVVVGGTLSDNKGINLQGGGLSAQSLTEKDRADIRVAADMQADYVAVSFPRSADDINEARELLYRAGGHGGIVAKIERAEAMQALNEIIEASDAVMIARGDLGVEIGDAELPAVQKRIIRIARTMDRVVITATQMMQSMIENPIPTRAEVLDVANAVLDGTDAVMLSAETAIGKHPVKVIEAMNRICLGAERHFETEGGDCTTLNVRFERIDQAIAMAAMFMARAMIGPEGRILGVLALQLPTERIRSIMQFTAGMGESGETYLVGPDLLMRSNSRFSSHSTVLQQQVDTPTVRRALAGVAEVDTLGDEPGPVRRRVPSHLGFW